MSFSRTKSGLRQLAVWCALAGVTVLLTLLFSFLGTLTAAVVAGVIVGSARRWQWRAIPISLVFPAVILALSHYSKIELPAGKVNLIALVCGAAFWSVCGMMFCLHFLEQKETAPPTNCPELANVERGAPGAVTGATRGLSLAALHGTWTCEDSRGDGAARRKTLQIEEGRFSLAQSDPRGRPRVIARGEVTLDQSQPNHPILRLKEEPDEAGGV